MFCLKSLNYQAQKNFNINKKDEYIKKLNFKLTNDQNNAIDEINKDLNSKERMFRLIQGDVGSGKTIVSLIWIILIAQIILVAIWLQMAK